jgi:hypothetical protein
VKPETRMSVAAMAAILGIAAFGGGARIVAKRQGRQGWSRPHQGAQEMARRVRQMERNAASKARRDVFWGAQS